MALPDAIRWLARERRRDRANLSAFRVLFAAPHDLVTGPLVMPAPGRLALSHPAGLAAAEGHRGIHAEEGFAIAQTGAPLGTLSPYLVDPLDGTHVADHDAGGGVSATKIVRHGKPRVPTVERPCLRCTRRFRSEGADHRTCDGCRQRAGDMGPLSCISAVQISRKYLFEALGRRPFPDL